MGILVIVGLAWCALSAGAQSTLPQPSGLALWYDKPAAQWLEALPVGNGRLGCTVFVALNVNSDVGNQCRLNTDGAIRMEDLLVPPIMLPDAHTIEFDTESDKSYSLVAAQQRTGRAESSDVKTISLENRSGLRWDLLQTPGGWALGTISLHDKRVEQAAARGLIALCNSKSGEVRWLLASQGEKVGSRAARLAGQQEIDGVKLSWSADVELCEDSSAARFTPRWSVNKDLHGWEVCLAYHDEFAHDWRVQSYPWAGNSAAADIAPMRYCGVPGALVYRPDLSMAVLFAIDPKSDYLNPTTWAGRTGFHFANRRTAPQFRVGGGKLTAGTRYEMPLQLFFSDGGGFAAAITGIMQAWIKANDYRVDDSLRVRTPQEALAIAVEGRRSMGSWKPGIGYEHHRGTPFIYVGNNPYIAYYEYRLYELTGEKLWRDRALEQIDFAIKGQQPNGALHTSYYFRKEQRPGGATADGFCSWDWFHDGYKVDINAWMARYILQTWQRVKHKEGVDRQDWYRAAIRCLDWVLAQQNPDGGFPQVVEISSGKRSESVVCGRTLVGLPIVAAITGEQHFLNASAGQERFLRGGVEGRFWYTGAHPDLPPGDFEQDSIYAVVEYWLDKHDRTGDKEYLDRAVANAYYALFYWCPKQLSWVKAPTQCAHSEQQHFNQYSVYCYGNRKIQCLDRLFKKTGNRLFEQLKNRVMQMNFYTQVTDGPYRGAVTEAIADPWLERGGGFQWCGSPYTSELVTDLMLQLIDMNLVPNYSAKPAYRKDSAGELIPRMTYSQFLAQTYQFALHDLDNGWATGNAYKDADGKPVPSYINYALASPAKKLGAGHPLNAEAVYPAFHHSLYIRALLARWRATGDAECLARARQLADWNIERCTPADWKYGSLFYSTACKGRVGGSVDGDAIMTDKPAIMALAMLELSTATGDARYREAAAAVAATLASTQLPEGCWPFRVNPQTGAIREAYTSSAIYAVMLFEAMSKSPDDRWAKARAKALTWILEGPAKTMQWKGFYEDVSANMGRDNRTNWDCIDTARWLIAHRAENAEYLPLALKLHAWISKEFVERRDAWGAAEGLREQKCCFQTMGIHTAHWAALLADLHAATGDESYKRRAIQSCALITYWMRDDGANRVGPTWGDEIWFSCHFGPALYLYDVVSRYPALLTVLQ